MEGGGGGKGQKRTSTKKRLRFKWDSLCRRVEGIESVTLVECSPTDQVREGPSALFTVLDSDSTQKEDDYSTDDEQEGEPGPPGIVLQPEDMDE
jgi:hypothetical protein